MTSDQADEHFSEPARPTDDDQAGRDLSVVVPVYNEAGNLTVLCREIEQALAGRMFEIVFVDDGSTDGSGAELEALAEGSKHVRVVQLARNFGQSAALAAGFGEARADVIVTIDGDRQNDPADIPALLAKLDEGYEVVSGWRRERTGSLLLRRIPSRVANWLIGRLMGASVRDNGSGLKVYRRELLEHVRLYGEGHRIILAQAHQLGASIAEIPISDRPRARGKSKYGLSRTYKVLLDLIALKFLASYAFKPIRVFGGVGLSLIVSSFGIALGLLIWRLVGGGFLIQTPLLLLAAVLLIVGVQLVLMGLLAELIVRLYHETKGAPTYRVRRRFGGENRMRRG
jgi:glycosyltransferase involved in cell wall biosynthesis